MGTTLFIAEKPSVAKAIIEVLGATERKDGYVICGNNLVSWCFGHMYEQATPDEYTSDEIPKGKNGRKIWRMEDLPILPKRWILNPKKETKAQIKTISGLIKKADLIVNAGDPDREGQLLIDELLEELGNKAPVKRYWVSSQDQVSVKRGLAALKNNQDYAGLADAARARARADWLIGMNLSRAYTLAAANSGARSLITVGRVQTPTLAMVVARDAEIESFLPKSFFTLTADIAVAGGGFKANWAPKEDQAHLDDKDRLINKAEADRIVAATTGKVGKITEYKQEKKQSPQPLGFSLTDMTLIASNKFGYSAKAVLDICQSLYETHKLTSYPRTDCPYLPEAQFADAPEVLAAIRHVNPDLVAAIDKADTNVKSRIWNDKKVTAHHGIIPTMHKGALSPLSQEEKNIYEIVVRGYLAQFYPGHEYSAISVVCTVSEENFKATGRVVLKPGWKDVYQDEKEDEGQKNKEKQIQTLPVMASGQDVNCTKTTRNDRQTTPPDRFTEGTLVAAMENIHKFVSDENHKKILKENEGIGTTATRGAIMEELKKRDFLELKGKKIISTTLGRSVIKTLPDLVKNPVLTALYERVLKGIETKTDTIANFVAAQEKFVTEQVKLAQSATIKIVGEKSAVTISEVYKCGVCGAGLIRRPTKEKGKYFWGCSGYPKCKQTYQDLKSRPDYSPKKAKLVKK